MTELDGLPAATTIRAGLRDLERGTLTVEALVVAIASQRLQALGLEVPTAAIPAQPELDLYARLGETSSDPYHAYGAVRRELDSFLSALEARRARDTRLR